MLTEQMQKDLANPADVIEIMTSNGAQIKAIAYGGTYRIATASISLDIELNSIASGSWHFNSQDLRETAAVFNALADTLDKRNGGANGE